MRTKRRWLQAVTQGVIIGLLVSAIFVAGIFVGDRLPVDAQDPQESSFELLAEVEDLLSSHYLRELPIETEMEYAAIQGYLGSLEDPYTFFIDPPVAQSESDVLAGEYGGIGVQLKLNERGQFVLYPFREGPAAQAGIQDGDVLLAVDGEPIAPGERADVIDRLLRGEVGEDRGVTITVQPVSAAADETEEFFIPFEVVQVPSVIWRTLVEEPSFGYVQMLRFTARTPEELRTALEELHEQEITALVLDLRGNSGGLLQESVQVASEFLDGGVVFYEVRRDGEDASYAKEGGAALNIPLVVLVDGGTASAAELVAGAIRDRDRGILIGQKTYGKGSVQLIFRLSDDSSVHITSAEWFTPARAVLDGVGLEPDISMIPAEDGRDVELGEAIRYLHAQLDTKTQ